MNKTAIITGASSGIGLSCALKFAEFGWNLVLTGRRKERLLELSDKLSKNYNADVKVLVFDVREEVQVKQVFDKFFESNAEIKIDLLVNNAGLAVGLDAFHEANTDDWNRMIDTNIKGLLYVSSIVSKKMVAAKDGHIINVSSIAGKESYANGHVYCGSKHAVEAITKGMRIDLAKYGIKVGSVAPGAVETEFSIVRFKGDEQRAKQVYEGYEQLLANDIADAVYYMASRPKHVNIADLTILPSAQATGSVIYKNI